MRKCQRCCWPNCRDAVGRHSGPNGAHEYDELCYVLKIRGGYTQAPATSDSTIWPLSALARVSFKRINATLFAHLYEYMCRNVFLRGRIKAYVCMLIWNSYPVWFTKGRAHTCCCRLPNMHMGSICTCMLCLYVWCRFKLLLVIDLYMHSCWRFHLTLNVIRILKE